MQFLFSFMNEVLAHLVNLNSGAFAWSHTAPQDFPLPSSSQWVLTAHNIPTLTTKGEDIVAAIMTIVHNGLVAVAQFSTLLPANALTG